MTAQTSCGPNLVALRTSPASSADGVSDQRERAELLRDDIVALASEFYEAGGRLWDGWTACACPACEAIRLERYGSASPVTRSA